MAVRNGSGASSGIEAVESDVGAVGEVGDVTAEETVAAEGDFPGVMLAMNWHSSISMLDGNDKQVSHKVQPERLTLQYRCLCQYTSVGDEDW